MIEFLDKRRTITGNYYDYFISLQNRRRNYAAHKSYVAMQTIAWCSRSDCICSARKNTILIWKKRTVSNPGELLFFKILMVITTIFSSVFDKKIHFWIIFPLTSFSPLHIFLHFLSNLPNIFKKRISPLRGFIWSIFGMDPFVVDISFIEFHKFLLVFFLWSLFSSFSYYI